MNVLEPAVPTPEAIRELREHCGLTQLQFAELILTTVDRVKKYESGLHHMRPALWLLARISCDSLVRAKWLRAVARSNT